MLKILFFLLLILSSTNRTIYSQNTEKAEWQSSLGGNALVSPKRTSYGFISLIDGGLISATTGSGTVIWRKSIKGNLSPFFNVTDENFIYIITDDATKLSLYNPDGYFLWSTPLHEPAIADPVLGRDGRVFIIGETSISCYGSHGTRKWLTLVPKGNGLPLTEINDGSLLYILLELKNNASIALRISPYGELLERIEFIDRISTLSSFNDGVILGFEKGTVAVCSVINNITETRWFVSSKNENNNPPYIILPGYDSFCVLFSNSNIAEYSIKTQSIIWDTFDQNIKIGQKIFAAFDYDRYVFASENYTVAYQTAQTGLGGTILWQKQFYPRENTFFPIITPSAYLVLLSKNWIISGYNLTDLNQTDKNVSVSPQIRTKPPTSQQNKPDKYTGFREKTKTPIVSYTNFTKMDKNITLGNYGTLEAEYKLIIQNYITNYEIEYMDSRYYFSNFAEKVKILDIAPKLETSDYDSLIQLMLSNETDASLLTTILAAAKNIAYDPDEIMLKAIENLFNTKKTILAPPVLIELSEAVYAICRYMGRPAFTKRGKEILSKMLHPNTEITVRANAQDVLVRFTKLEN